MNKETFVKRIKPLMTKSNELNKRYSFVMLYLLQGHNRFYYNRWSYGCRHFNLIDNSDRYFKVLKALKLKYILGDDAPKGGQEGNYIQLTDGSIRTAKELSKMYKSFIAAKHLKVGEYDTKYMNEWFNS